MTMKSVQFEVNVEKVLFSEIDKMTFGSFYCEILKLVNENWFDDVEIHKVWNEKEECYYYHMFFLCDFLSDSGFIYLSNSFGQIYGKYNDDLMISFNVDFDGQEK
jgi:hypothetical protein